MLHSKSDIQEGLLDQSPGQSPDEFVDGFPEQQVPQPKVPSPGPSPYIAFFIAAGVTLPFMLFFAYQMNLLLDKGDLFEEKQLYDNTVEDAKAYGMMPANFTDPSNGGKNLDSDQADAYAAEVAYYIAAVDLIYRALKSKNYVMITALVVAGTAFAGQVIDLLESHRKKIIDIRFPQSEGALIKDIAVLQDPLEGAISKTTSRTLHIFYPNLAIKEPKRQGAWIYQLTIFFHNLFHDKLLSWMLPESVHGKYFDWMPSLADLRDPIIVTLSSILFVNLLQDSYSVEFKQNAYDDAQDSAWKYLDGPYHQCGGNSTMLLLNQTASDAEMACDSESYELGGIYGEQDVMDHSAKTAQTLAWATPFIPALMIFGADLLYKCVIGHDRQKRSPVWEFAMDVLKNVPAFLLLAMVVKEFTSTLGGFAALGGKESYDDAYYQSKSYALRSISDGGLGYNSDKAEQYALRTARNFFNNYLYGTPMTLDIWATRLLLACAGLNASIRAGLLIAMQKAKFVHLSEPHTKESRDQYLAGLPSRGQLRDFNMPAFMGAYYNWARDFTEQQLRGSQLYWFLNEVWYSPTLVNFSNRYYPVAGAAVLSVLTTAIILNIASSDEMRGSYLKNYNSKLTSQITAENCQSDGQMTDCESQAADEGEQHAVYDLMDVLGGSFGRVFIFGSIAAFALFVLLDAVYRAFNCAATAAPAVWSVSDEEESLAERDSDVSESVSGLDAAGRDSRNSENDSDDVSLRRVHYNLTGTSGSGMYAARQTSGVLEEEAFGAPRNAG
ncbi:MAG: hypothetical protein KBD83_05195 [Gammaproteobacteria bacterium]|nr:hypothetical protein [Gammaproteobacteria bacterium]